MPGLKHQIYPRIAALVATPSFVSFQPRPSLRRASHTHTHTHVRSASSPCSTCLVGLTSRLRSPFTQGDFNSAGLESIWSSSNPLPHSLSLPRHSLKFCHAVSAMANTEQSKGPKVPSRAASLQRMLEIERKQKVSKYALFDITNCTWRQEQPLPPFHNRLICYSHLDGENATKPIRGWPRPSQRLTFSPPEIESAHPPPRIFPAASGRP